MNFSESALRFDCGGAWLYGVLSMPEHAGRRGVLILVGGPQYRAGSHRQFTLLARRLAAEGIPVMRFDYGGMGDSEGEAKSFEEVGDDLSCAIRHFREQVPVLDEIVLWGLCDAASTAMLHAAAEPRVCGLVLLNPWVHSEAGMARTYLKHYYLARLMSADFWRKMRGGHLNYGASARSLVKLMAASMQAADTVHRQAGAAAAAATETTLAQRMLAGLQRFDGHTLLILSGNDLTAREFSDLAAGSPAWQALLQSPRMRKRTLPEANHTFSRSDWRDQVASWTTDWIRSW